MQQRSEIRNSGRRCTISLPLHPSLTRVDRQADTCTISLFPPTNHYSKEEIVHCLPVCLRRKPRVEGADSKQTRAAVQQHSVGRVRVGREKGGNSALSACLSTRGSGGWKIGRVLVANRGEIALRIMRTSKQMGIKTIAVYSDADSKSLHVQFADEAYRIGEASALRSYLCADRIVQAALSAGADAIHPGYGFLSENANFAEQCAANGLIFMGPSAEAIRAMGMKNTAKNIMTEANVPVVRGYNGAEQNDAHLLEKAREIGFPIMMKAVCGGGGKGMRIALDESQFAECLDSARSEALKAFGNGDMILERYVQRPRHVEVQIFGDSHGNFVYLWERDCSIQRRHQKIIEEAPAPGLSPETRHWLGKTAVEAARAVGYVGAGTVEFIMDPADGQFYFMEMNTRLQVEHPITEAITGLDLVQWQFLVAQGDRLPLTQQQISLNGHAMEARIYAEDSAAGFMPTAGHLEHLFFPSSVPHLRVDSGVREGDEISVHYDPMVAKVIAWGADRSEAIRRLDEGLRQTRIGGLSNNVRFVRACLAHERFRLGDVYTDFVAEHIDQLLTHCKSPTVVARGRESVGGLLVEAALAQLLLSRFRSLCAADPSSPFAHQSPFYASPTFFRMNHFAHRTLRLDAEQSAEVEIQRDGFYRINLRFADGNQQMHNVRVGTVQYDKTATTGKPMVRFSLEMDERKRWECTAVLLERELAIFGQDEHQWPNPFLQQTDDGTSGAVPLLDGVADGKARSPIPGLVEKVFVKADDPVVKGQPLVAMSSMKMEFIIRAPFDGTAISVFCTPGQNVAKDVVLLLLNVAKTDNDENQTEGEKAMDNEGI
ncbi:hypothetical protein niasHT_006956 [Heterodera trifolii]|uniref:Uncharacterized protein n=1 Tax=Heterodera trifolii TaxID=157864 RepID=A0ABD2LN14_9BILA